MSKERAVSVIIGYVGGEHILHGCINSLLNTLNKQDEIIVIINTESVSVHRGIEKSSYTKNIKVINIYEKIGHAEAMNIGAKEAKNEYIVLGDYDLIFLANWKEELFTAIDETGAHIAFPKIINPLNDKISEFGIAYTCFNGAHPYQDLDRKHLLVSERHYPQAACSGGMLLKKENFFRLGGFSNEFRTMYSDVSFCMEAKKNKYKIVGEPKAEVYHYGGWTSKRNRDYKNILIKGDHKGAFCLKYSAQIEIDLEKYFVRSAKHISDAKIYKQKYIFCNLLNVADYFDYEAILEKIGFEKYESYRVVSGNRDADQESLYDLLGYQIMVKKVPVIYLVDRYISIVENNYWWASRNYESDIVVDRNANIMRVAKIIHT